MKEKIFLDTDVILDLLLDKKPFCISSQKIFALIEQNKIEGSTSSLILSNSYYIIRRLSSHLKAVKAINKMRAILTILPFTNKEIGESISAEFKYMEDGIQHFIALNNNINVIITRNIKDFEKSSLRIVTPEEYYNIYIVKNKINPK